MYNNNLNICRKSDTLKTVSNSSNTTCSAQGLTLIKDGNLYKEKDDYFINLSIPLTKILNLLTNYYTKEEVDTFLQDIVVNNNFTIIDNLLTEDADKALSAKQGKILNDTKADKEAVYTKEEVKDLIKNNSSGGQYNITYDNGNLIFN